jgi:hypothetical protein
MLGTHLVFWKDINPDSQTFGSRKNTGFSLVTFELHTRLLLANFQRFSICVFAISWRAKGRGIDRRDERKQIYAWMT